MNRTSPRKILMIESSRGEEIGVLMVIKRFTEPELKVFREQCNFVNDEIDVFEMRSKGIPLEQIAELKGFTYDGIKKISREVNTKIARIQHLLDA